MAGIGGILAVSLIVVIAVGIGALTLLFLGSAVFALERFARVAKRWRTLVGCGLTWSGVVGCGILYVQAPELSESAWDEWVSRWAIVSAQTARVIAALIISIPITLRWSESRAITRMMRLWPSISSATWCPPR